MGKQKKKNDADRERATEKILSIVDNLPYDATQECLMNIMLYNLIFHLIQKEKFVEQLEEEQKKVLEAQFFFHLTYANQIADNISKQKIKQKGKRKGTRKTKKNKKGGSNRNSPRSSRKTRSRGRFCGKSDSEERKIQDNLKKYGEVKEIYNQLNKVKQEKMVNALKLTQFDGVLVSDKFMKQEELWLLRDVIIKQLSGGMEGITAMDNKKGIALLEASNKSVESKIIRNNNEQENHNKSDRRTRSKSRSNSISSRSRSRSSSRSRSRSSDKDFLQRVAKEREAVDEKIAQEKKSAKISDKVYKKALRDAGKTYDEIMKVQAEKIMLKYTSKAKRYLKPHGVYENKKKEFKKDKNLIAQKELLFKNSLGFLMMMMISVSSGYLYYGPEGEIIIPDHTDPAILEQGPLNISEGYKTTLDYYCAPFFGIILSVIYLWQRGWFSREATTGGYGGDLYTNIFLGVINGLMTLVIGFLNLIPRFNRAAFCIIENQESNRDYDEKLADYTTKLMEYNECYETSTNRVTARLRCTSPPPEPVSQNVDMLTCMIEGTSDSRGSYTLAPTISYENVEGNWDMISKGLLTFSKGIYNISASLINVLVNIICNAFDMIGQQGIAFPVVHSVITVIGAKMAYDAYKNNRNIKEIQDVQAGELFKISEKHRFNIEDAINDIDQPPGGPTGEVKKAKQDVAAIQDNISRQQFQIIKMELDSISARAQETQASAAVELARLKAEELQNVYEQQKKKERLADDNRFLSANSEIQYMNNDDYSDDDLGVTKEMLQQFHPDISTKMGLDQTLKMSEKMNQ
jgi:hypothetical protein